MAKINLVPQLQAGGNNTADQLANIATALKTLTTTVNALVTTVNSMTANGVGGLHLPVTLPSTATTSAPANLTDTENDLVALEARYNQLLTALSGGGI